MKTEFLTEEVLVESKKENGKLYLEGIYLAYGCKNRNGRLYPGEVLNPEVNRFITESIEKKSAYGECPHPDTMVINPGMVSHRIISLREEGNFWMGKASILDTPRGNIVKAIIEDGGVIGMSSRGTGSLKESLDKKTKIVESYNLKTIDIVLDPSVKESVMSAIYEQKEVMYCEDKKCYMLAEDIRASIKKATKNQVEKTLLEGFKKYINYLGF